MQELRDLKQFFRHVGGVSSPEDDFDIRILEQNINTGHNFDVFRHRIYLIIVYTSVYVNPEALSPVLNSSQPFLFLKVPFQILSTENTPILASGFYIAFTESFLAKYNFLSSMVSEMPYLHLDGAFPFEIEPNEANLLRITFDQMLSEYQSNLTGRAIMIATYLQVYLLQIRRIYESQNKSSQSPSDSGILNDLAIATRFRLLLDAFFKEVDDTAAKRTIAYYAEKLAMHPNYLNAALKRATGKTAHELLHEHLIAMAKNLLSQTSLTVKEIAYQLSFNDPAHFTNFFKRYTSTTPIQFRLIFQNNLQVLL